MAINKATLAKEIDGVIEYIYPKTSGDIVVYDDTRSVSAMISMLVNNKMDKVDGKGLSTNDFNDSYRNKLESIEAGANKTTIDSAISSTSVNPVQNAAIAAGLADKEKSHRVIEYTLKANRWTGNIYSFENEFPGNRYTVYINIAHCQPYQYEAIGKAMIMGSDMSSGTNIITALGDVPVIDLPIVLEIVER